ncbi:energy transducer TonB [Taibaiella soli]|uniref:TonB C-terminal domain-containing protein n=1 Tax=Taibaiella soli TaxID=1649169 RepID=A0A2W2C3L0_9BACT|nr:energy transducer TonB [Taibaiella soli]PZF74703.1 hypothetical protein DN068_00455 [Taibaiella soli]
MKYTAILVCLLLCSLYSFAQNDTIFFNKSWKPTTSRDSAAYFRLKPKAENGLYHVTDYYISGIPQMVGTFSQIDSEVKEGYFTYYDSLGHKEDEGDYRNNKRNGFWKFYYSNSDKLKYTGLFRKDSAEGVFHYYHAATGKMYNRIEYKNGKKNGESLAYFADGKTLHYKNILRKDTILSQRIYDSASGFPINIYDYDPKADTSYRTVYFRGTKKVSQIHRFGHFYTGNTYSFDSLSGKLRSTGHFTNNIPDSIWTYYRKGTNILRSTQRHGSDTIRFWTVFYDTLNGRTYKSSEGNCIHTQNDSTWYRYYPNGAVKSISYYVNGKLDKGYTSYDSLENILSKGYYASGEKTGVWQYWDPKTLTLLAKKSYLSGHLVGPQEYYYPNGKIKTSEHYNIYTQMTNGKSYTNDGKETEYKPSAINASFPGEFDEYKETYLVYPPSTLIMNEGKVKIKFTIAEDGGISDTKLVDGIGLLWDENALRFVNEMPKWNPAYYNGLPTESVCYMTFVYKKDPAHIKVTYSNNP